MRYLFFSNSPLTLNNEKVETGQALQRRCPSSVRCVVLDRDEKTRMDTFVKGAFRLGGWISSPGLLFMLCTEEDGNIQSSDRVRSPGRGSPVLAVRFWHNKKRSNKRRGSRFFDPCTLLHHSSNGRFYLFEPTPPFEHASQLFRIFQVAAEAINVYEVESSKKAFNRRE